jgi:cation diffusion facilitator family transporter
MMEQPTTLTRSQSDHMINKVSTVGIVGNILLSGFKLFAGIFAHSGAMLSDAIHSLSDVFATLIAWIGVRLSRKVADKGHPYGHERLESVASLLLAVVLLITGLAIGYSGMGKIIGGSYETLAVPGTLALIAAVVSIVVKESMFWYTMYYAKKLNSSAFRADAWHHRSDALSSIGSLVGIGAARLGFPVMDPIASVVICLFILKVAYDIGKTALRQMTDCSCPDDVEGQLRQCILSEEGVLGIDSLRTRLFGDRIYVEVEIEADGNDTLSNTHAVAERVHSRIEHEFLNVKHIMVHVNPRQEEKQLQP